MSTSPQVILRARLLAGLLKTVYHNFMNASRPDCQPGLKRTCFSVILLMSLVSVIWGTHVTADTLATTPGETENQTSGQRQVIHGDLKSGKSVSGPSALNIVEYYVKASPVNSPALPDGLRVSRWGISGHRGKAPPVITSQCLRFAPGEFSRLFLRSPYARRLRELFVEQGADAGKITNLLIAHSAGGNEVVSIFDEGYMILFDEDQKTAYIFPIGTGMGEKVFSLTR